MFLHWLGDISFVGLGEGFVISWITLHQLIFFKIGDGTKKKHGPHLSKFLHSLLKLSEVSKK